MLYVQTMKYESYIFGLCVDILGIQNFMHLFLSAQLLLNKLCLNMTPQARFKICKGCFQPLDCRLLIPGVVSRIAPNQSLILLLSFFKYVV